MKNIPYGHQWIDKNDREEIVKVLKSDWLTQGPKVEEFENALAKYCNAKYCAVFSSGTAALHAAYFAAGVKEGDEVITTPLTFAATANAAVYCGATPVFADIDPETVNIDPEEVEKKITKKTKVIAPVDFAGHPCDYDKILTIAKKHKLLVIEDAAHALGSEYKGKKVGSFSDMTILSFHPVKTITTGEGGAVLTNNEGFYGKLKVFRQHGIVKKPEKGKWYYEIEDLGYNYRLTDLQCALGLSQLKKADRFIKRRREIVSVYNKAFENLKEIILPTEKKYAKSAWHIYVIQLVLERLRVGRKEIFNAFQEAGIGVQVHYIPVYSHPFYKKNFNYKKENFPATQNYYERCITLPLFPAMTKGNTQKVIFSLRKIISFYKRR